MTKELPKLQQVPIEGIDLGNGSYKTKMGVIRVPMSRMKQLKKEARHEEVEEEPPVIDAKRLPRRVNPEEQSVVFTSPMGNITGKYFPVVDTGEFIVLGLTEQSFIPVSYKENNTLTMVIKYNNKEAQIVYSGCRFKDPDTEREYIVLIKVGGTNGNDKTVQ